MLHRWIRVLTLVAVLSLPFGRASADTVFYEGKTITIVVGTTAGGTIAAARLLARHLGKYIPGNPAVVVQTMPGGAHLVATNHVFSRAKADGLTLLAANPNVAIAQLVKVDNANFDVRKFEWLGSSGADSVVLTIRADLPFKTFDEFRQSGRELRVGSTGPGSNAHDFPLLLKEFASAKFRFVSGYAANPDILLALQRNEVDVWAAFAAAVRPALQYGTIRPLVRARVPSPGFDYLPVDESFTTNPIGKALMAIKAAPLAIGRAVAAPPGTPDERLALLRSAFARAIQDPDLEAEARKMGLDVLYISWEQVLQRFTALMKQTPDVQKEMTRYIKFGG